MDGLRDMIRGGSNGLRAHFTRATCPSFTTISTSDCHGGEPTSRWRQSRTEVLAPYRSVISAGSGPARWLASPAPGDYSCLGRRCAAEGSGWTDGPGWEFY